MSNTMKPRSVTRMSLASPIFWLAFGAWLAGLLSAMAGSEVGMVSAGLATAGIATATYGVERWYITARAKAIVTQGIVDALEMRPDLFVVCPEHGDGCSATCRARARR